MTAGLPPGAAPPGVAEQAALPPGDPRTRRGSHRAQRSPAAVLVPVLVVAVSVVAVGVGAYGWVTALDSPEALPDVTPVVSVPTPTTALPSPSGAPTPTPTPKPTHSTQPTPSPKASHSTQSEPSPRPVARDYPVVVLNQTGVTGLAAATAADLRRTGWTVTGVGNWRGDLLETTVYYPPGEERQAQQLARDLGVDRVRPRSSPMRSDRLTVILAGRQG